MATFDALFLDAPLPNLGSALKIDNVRTRIGTFPIAYGEIATIAGTSPGVGLITVLSSTSIRVNFEYVAVNNSALVNPGNYVITPTLAVHTVTPGPGNPSYVILTTDEQKSGQSYSLSLQRIARMS